MIGSIVGNYKITAKIGEGGMGAVFRGLDEMLERDVAIKMLRPDLTRESEIVERFRSEAITLAKLNHPNIATLHSFFRQGDDFFMVMEYVRGETLDSIIRRSGPFPVERAVQLFGLALEGIGHAHTMGIIHRDIKPANLMVNEKGSVKVMDFGIARMLGSTRMTRQGTIIGTVEYMAPEQIQGKDSDARTDIYSLGILLYEMLTGRVPFKNDSEYGLMMMQINDSPPPPRTLAPHIPLHIEQAIMRALAKRPEARFQSVGEFRLALQGSSVTNPLAQKTASSVPLNQLAVSQDGVATRPIDVHSQMGNTMVVNPTTGPRQGQSGSTQLVSPSAGAFYSTGQQSGYSTAPQTTSFFSRLKFPHYLTAALLLAVLVGAPLYLLNANKNELKNSTVTQPNNLTTEPKTDPKVDEPKPTKTNEPVNTSNPNSNTSSTVDADKKGTIDGTDKKTTTDSTDEKSTAKDEKPTKPEKDAAAARAAAAAREKARKAKEARKLLDQ
ncbi:MAG: serine/threonine-protein kinase [Acidobacteriota bacterium]